MGPTREYSLIKPGKKDSIKSVPEGCIGVYKDTMETGLRFPLHPFVIEVLNSYNIAVSKLYPNDWGCIIAFIMIYIAISIEPTLTAFRYIFRLRRCTAAQGLGWVTFQHRRGFFIVEGLRESMKHFINDFVFLYRTVHGPSRQVTINGLTSNSTTMFPNVT